MKKKHIVLIIVAVIVVLLAVFVPLYILNDEVNLAFWRFIPTKLPEGFTVTAHSGCENTPPNTIASMQAGYDVGAEIIEIDLHFDGDGKCVLSHDEPINGEKYDTLEDACAFLKEKTTLKANLDLKSTKNMPFVYDLIVEYGLSGRVFFTGVNEERAEIIKKDCPGVKYYLNVDGNFKDDEEVRKAVEKTKKCGAVGVNFHYSKLTKKIVDACRKNGLLVSVYTVDKTATIPHVLLYRPDNVTTRRPSVVIKQVGTRPKK